MNPEEITRLIEKNRYSPDILTQLEPYVQHQVDTQNYHLEANLAVLKLYQFYPEKIRIPIVSKILIKALMNLPKTDYLLCSYLLTEKTQNEPVIGTLSKLADSLESADFVGFWSISQTCRELLDTIPGFDHAIRTFIISVLTLSYQRVGTDFLCQVLSMERSDLDTLVQAHDWSFEKSAASNSVNPKDPNPSTALAEFVCFPLTEENQAKTRNIPETIHFHQLAKIISAANTY